ncbi:hypothetical protein BDR04DRAFT_971262, partial [Suillus decipiens]
MNTISASTGFAPFQLHLGCSPWMLPPLLPTQIPLDSKEQRAHALLSQLKYNIMEAQDNLLAAKATQATIVKKNHTPPLILQVGDCVMLATKHHCHEYIQKGDKCIAK